MMGQYTYKKSYHRACCLSLLPCEHTLRRWPSANQKESLHQKTIMVAPRSQNSSLQNCGKINFYCLSYQDAEFCYGSPSEDSWFTELKILEENHIVFVLFSFVRVQTDHESCLGYVKSVAIIQTDLELTRPKLVINDWMLWSLWIQILIQAMGMDERLLKEKVKKKQRKERA